MSVVDGGTAQTIAGFDAAVAQLEALHGGASQVELRDDAVGKQHIGERGAALLTKSSLDPSMCTERRVTSKSSTYPSRE